MSTQIESFAVRATAVNIPTTVRTIAAQTPVISVGGGLAQNVTISVSGVLNITPGAATTQLVIGLYSNGNTVQQDTPVAIPAAAGVIQQIAFQFQDTTGAAAAQGGANYAITVTQTSATGAGTVNLIEFEANILSN
jgi:hypothetical protein